jgi:hypothetical protein
MKSLSVSAVPTTKPLQAEDMFERANTMFITTQGTEGRSATLLEDHREKLLCFPNIFTILDN